jgi:hypothetical protein
MEITMNAKTLGFYAVTTHLHGEDDILVGSFPIRIEPTPLHDQAIPRTSRYFPDEPIDMLWNVVITDCAIRDATFTRDAPEYPDGVPNVLLTPYTISKTTLTVTAVDFPDHGPQKFVPLRGPDLACDTRALRASMIEAITASSTAIKAATPALSKPIWPSAGPYANALATLASYTAKIATHPLAEAYDDVGMVNAFLAGDCTRLARYLNHGT